MNIPRIQISLVAEDDTNELIAMNEPNAAAKAATELIGNADREHFLCFHLNAKNMVISHDIVSIGTLGASLVHPREVFKGAILANAAAIIIVHNHPSGDTKPSREDNQVTDRLCEAGKLLGIPVLDHIVVTNSGDYLSYSSQGILPK